MDGYFPIEFKEEYPDGESIYQLVIEFKEEYPDGESIHQLVMSLRRSTLTVSLYSLIV